MDITIDSINNYIEGTEQAESEITNTLIALLTRVIEKEIEVVDQLNEITVIKSMLTGQLKERGIDVENLG